MGQVLGYIEDTEELANRWTTLLCLRKALHWMQYEAPDPKIFERAIQKEKRLYKDKKREWFKAA